MFGEIRLKRFQTFWITAKIIRANGRVRGCRVKWLLPFGFSLHRVLAVLNCITPAHHKRSPSSYRNDRGRYRNIRHFIWRVNWCGNKSPKKGADGCGLTCNRTDRIHVPDRLPWRSCVFESRRKKKDFRIDNEIKFPSKVSNSFCLEKRWIRWTRSGKGSQYLVGSPPSHD